MDFTALRAALRTDTTLKELAKIPLTLNVMTWAYSNGEALPRINSLEERRKHMFNKYIERMFQRRKKENQNDPNQSGTEQQYSKNETRRWLILLAIRMNEESQTIFLIEKMQPSWLQSRIQKRLYKLGVGLVFGLIWGFMLTVGGGIGFGSVGASLGIGTGLAITYWSSRNLFIGKTIEKIETIETLNWSWNRAWLHLQQKKNILGIVLTLIVMLILWFLEVKGIITPKKIGLNGLILQLTCFLASLFNIIINTVIVALHGPDIERKTEPNQGMWKTFHNTVIYSLIFMFIIFLIFGLTGFLLNGLLVALLLGIVGCLSFGLLFGAFSGVACIQHLSLRIVLLRYKYIPRNYAHFLDYATERIFLQKVGGGYIFIHRLLQDHFATLKPEKIKV